MITILQLWGLLGVITFTAETVALHRRGQTIAGICADIRRSAAQGDTPQSIAAILGRRWMVILIIIGLWPVPIAIRLRILRP